MPTKYWKILVTAAPRAPQLSLIHIYNDDKCIGVITWMHTFSPAKMWIHGLQELKKPLLHFHTQFNKEIPWETMDMDFMHLNQSAHGDREFGHIVTRMRKNRKVVVGHMIAQYLFGTDLVTVCHSHVVHLVADVYKRQDILWRTRRSRYKYLPIFGGHSYTLSHSPLW